MAQIYPKTHILAAVLTGKTCMFDETAIAYISCIYFRIFSSAVFEENIEVFYSPGGVLRKL